MEHYDNFGTSKWVTNIIIYVERWLKNDDPISRNLLEKILQSNDGKCQRESIYQIYVYQGI